ncbi:MAG: hypothetical protein H7Z70_09740 [Bacteroidia bacterium]|nr:hypothetical protein [Methylotenera sp.]
MSKSWLKTSTQNKADTFSFEFWGSHRKDIYVGEFWADRIKAFKGEPVTRLQFAIQNLPLPAAFREAVIAIRSLVREKRKNSDVYQDELALLYWLAVMDSFSVPYSETLCEPGYNIIESIPGDVVKNLPFTYHQIGYNKLSLLNLTDITWIIELWGEPESHSTLNVFHNKTWHEYELKLLNHRKAQKHGLEDSVFEPMNLKQLTEARALISKLEINK